MSAIKIGGIAIFAVAAIWASGLGGGAFAEPVAGLKGAGFDGAGFIASIAFSILAFKGFTTITNSGGEIVDPHRNVGRSEEHTSELQSLMRISYAVFCLKK